MTIEPCHTPNEFHILPSLILLQAEHEDGTPAHAYMITLQWAMWGIVIIVGADVVEEDER